MSRVPANDIHLTTSSDNPTVFTSLLDRAFDLHRLPFDRPRYGASLFIVCLSLDDWTSCIHNICRFALFDLWRRRCDWCPLVRKIFPLPVIRNRFAVALWVFNLYFLLFAPLFFLGLILVSQLIPLNFRCSIKFCTLLNSITFRPHFFRLRWKQCQSTFHIGYCPC